MIAIVCVGAFLIVCGALFVVAALAPPGLSWFGGMRARLELYGAFERGAALVSGLLFLATGGMVTLGVEQMR